MKETDTQKRSSQDHEIQADYISHGQERITFFLVASVFFAGLAPGLFDLLEEREAAVTVLLSLVIATFVYWFGSWFFVQERILCAKSRQILQISRFRKWLNWSKTTVVADFDDIAAVYVNAKNDLFSKTRAWLYPVILVKHNGREVPIANDPLVVSDHERAKGAGRQLAEYLGCELLFGDAETPLEVKRQGRAFVCEPKNQDVGLWGRALVAVSIFFLIWGLVTLLPTT